MPTIHTSLLAGYDQETKRRFKQSLANTVIGELNANPEGVLVWLHEEASENYQRGYPSTPLSVQSPKPAEKIVQEYLAAMEQRDLDLAKTFIGSGFHMVFPGNVRFEKLEDLVAWSRTRYQSVTKKFDTLSTAHAEGASQVTCHGVLSIVLLNGDVLDGVRFCDFFTIQNQKIVRQEVWNDMAEVLRSRTK